MEQLEALRAIRADVDSGDAARALARIDAFNASYAGSPLAEEVLVLRIDALSRAERKAEAAALATSFLQRFPTSAYGTRVRAIAFQ
jgi:outer membrane protein assembly factor BamD (BamD/ComL family)